MLFPQESMTGEALIEATFQPEDVPDTRLFRRLKTTAAGVLRAVMDEGDERPQDVKRAERRGATRLYANERVDTDLLCQHAQQRCVEAIKSLPRVLVAHDTVEFDLHGRYEPDDAGPLRSSQARGYLLHHGVVLDPQSDARVGILYMGAWTRPYPEGKRPEGKRRVRREWDNEDDKWSWGVEQAHKALQRSGVEAHVRHLADHEGSSYASLVKAKRRKRDYASRTQVDRNIAEGSGKLFEYLLEQPVVAGSLVVQRAAPALKEALALSLGEGVRPTYSLRVCLNLAVGAAVAALAPRRPLPERWVAWGTAVAVGVSAAISCAYP